MDCDQQRDQCVTELSEENGKSIHNEEVAARKEKPVATKQKEQFIPSSFFILDDCCADRSTEVACNSCH